MKHTIFIVSVLLLLAGLVGCQKYSNEDIEAQWKLVSMEDLATGAEQMMQGKTVAEWGSNWNFQLDLLQMRQTQRSVPAGLCPEAIARYRKTSDSLFVEPVYWHFRNRDSLLTDDATTALEHFGVRGNAGAFAVEKFSDDEMVLTSATDRLRFKKW